MPAIAEKIYAKLIKDPDLDIPTGLTREEVARTEADQRERQHQNNAVALSLFKEELAHTYGNSIQKIPYYKALPEHQILYDNLSPEAQEHIDLLYSKSKQSNVFTKPMKNLVSKIFEELSNEYHSEHGSTGLEHGGEKSNKKVKDALNKAWDDVNTHVLKNDDHMQEILGNHDELDSGTLTQLHDLIKTINPDTKMEKPKTKWSGQEKVDSSGVKQKKPVKATLGKPEKVGGKGAGTLQQDINAAMKAEKEHYGEPKDKQHKDLTQEEKDNFSRADVPYHVQTVGGKSHKLAMQHGLADGNGLLTEKGHGLIDWFKKTDGGVKYGAKLSTGSFQPKSIQYTKEKKYVLPTKSIQALIDTYETKTGKQVSASDHGIKGVPIPQGLQTTPSEAYDLEAEYESISDEAAEPKPKAKPAPKKTKEKSFDEKLDESDEADATQQLTVDNEKLLDQADLSGLVDFIHEDVEGHGFDNPYHTKEDTLKKLLQKKDLKEYLGKMHNNFQKDIKQKEENYYKKEAKEKAAKEKETAKQQALEDKQKLKEQMQTQKEKQAEAQVMPEHSEGEDVNLHAEEMLAHVNKYQKHLSGAQKKQMAKKISDLFDKNKAPKSFKGKAADKKEVNKNIANIGGVSALGSDEHMESIQFDKAHKKDIEEHHGKLHSKEGAASKQAAFETGDHHATTNFDEDGNVTGHSTSSHNAEGKTTAGKSSDEGYSSGGHDGIHHLNHPMNPAQENTFNQYKEAMKAGDTEAADTHKQNLIDSGIPESSFETEDKSGYPDPDVAKKKIAEGYVFNEETRHWILKENLDKLGGMGAHDAEIHSSTSTNEAGQAFALKADGTPHKGNFMVSQAGVHKLGDDHATNISNVPKMGGMTQNQTKSNAIGHALSNSSYGKLHKPGDVTSISGALHERGSVGALFSGGSGALLHGTGIEHSKNVGHKKPAYAKAQQKKKAETIDAAKTIGKYAALGYSPQVAKFMGKVGKNLSAKIKKIKQAKAPKPKMTTADLKASQAKVKAAKAKVKAGQAKAFKPKTTTKISDLKASKAKVKDIKAKLKASQADVKAAEAEAGSEFEKSLDKLNKFLHKTKV